MTERNPGRSWREVADENSSFLADLLPVRRKGKIRDTGGPEGKVRAPRRSHGAQDATGDAGAPTVSGATFRGASSLFTAGTVSVPSLPRAATSFLYASQERA